VMMTTLVIESMPACKRAMQTKSEFWFSFNLVIISGEMYLKFQPTSIFRDCHTIL
jgi:hypothetical protein